MSSQKHKKHLLEEKKLSHLLVELSYKKTLSLFNLYGSCIQEVYSKMTHYEIKKCVINCEQEKTYKVNKNTNPNPKYFIFSSVNSNIYNLSILNFDVDDGFFLI